MKKKVKLKIAPRELVLAGLVLVVIGIAVYQSLRVRQLEQLVGVAPKDPRYSVNLKYTPQKLTCGKRSSYKIESKGTMPEIKANSISVPRDDTSAILGINSDCGNVLILTGTSNVKYNFCSTISLYDAGGKPAQMSSFKLGSYVHATPDGTCMSSMQLVPPPQKCSGGYGGGASVFFVGGNTEARSIVYQPTGNTDLMAERLCENTVVTDVDKSAVGLQDLKEGQPVFLLLDGNNFVNSVAAEKTIRQ